MGQLEKYGLYVMCLVIFLILGVSLWDVGDPTTPAKKTPAISTEIATNGNAGGRSGTGGTGGVDSLEVIDSLFQPTERRDGKQPKPAAGGPRGPDATATEASASKGGDRGAGDQAGGDKPGPAPVDPVKPADDKRTKYRIQDGDTLEGVARQKLGSASLHAEIQRLNPNVKANNLRVGQEIVLPSAADLAPRTSTKAPATTTTPPLASSERLYTVRKGDNLEGIAGSQLGDKRRVEELRRLNPNVEETKLRIGQSLKLPKK